MSPADQASPQLDGSAVNPPSETDYVIMNVYSRVKNLENKYIDLANFYKESLVREQEKKNILIQHINSSGGSLSGRAKSQSSLVSQVIDQSTQEAMKQSDTFTENVMIRSLIDEKRELEENMKMLKQVVEQKEIQT